MSAKKDKKSQLEKLSASEDKFSSSEKNAGIADTERQSLELELTKEQNKYLIAEKRVAAKSKQDDNTHALAILQKKQQEDMANRGKIGIWLGDSTHTVVYVNSILLVMLLVAVFVFAYFIPALREDIGKGLLPLAAAVAGYLGGRKSQ